MFSVLDKKVVTDTVKNTQRMQMQEDTVNHILSTLTELVNKNRAPIGASQRSQNYFLNNESSISFDLSRDFADNIQSSQY